MSQPFTKDTFEKMMLGDTLLTEGVLPGVCDEPLKWRLIKINKNRTVARFTTSYFGTFFGEFDVNLGKDKIRVTPL